MYKTQICRFYECELNYFWPFLYIRISSHTHLNYLNVELKASSEPTLGLLEALKFWAAVSEA